MGALLAGIGTDSAQAPESLQDDFRLSEDRNRVGLETCARSETGFKLAAEDYSREREFDGSGGKRGAKEDFGRPAAGDGHEPHAQGNEALANQEPRMPSTTRSNSLSARAIFAGSQATCAAPTAVAMNSLGSRGNQIGLIFMDLGLVSGVNGPSFLRGERQVAEALAGAVFAGAQGRVLGIDRAQGAAVAGKVEFNGCQGVRGAQAVNFALAEALQAFEGGVPLGSFCFEQRVKGCDER